MGRIVDEDVHSITLRLAGTFTPTDELYRQAERARELTARLFERTRTSGVIRPDLTVDDLSSWPPSETGADVGPARRGAHCRPPG